jgi:hypothetical protein
MAQANSVIQTHFPEILSQATHSDLKDLPPCQLLHMSATAFLFLSGGWSCAMLPRKQFEFYLFFKKRKSGG